jgi:hypothetical protein
MMLTAAAAQESTSTIDSRKGYAKIAAYCGEGLVETRKAKPAEEDFVSVIAKAKELLLDIRAMGNVDPELKAIAADVEQATEQGIECLETIKRLPPPPPAVSQIIRNLYYGGTAQFQAAEKYDNAVQGQSADIQAQIRRLIEAVNRQKAAALMLPRIAKKLSGPAIQSKHPLRVDIDETWGFAGPDWLTVVNASGRTLNNCTVVVRLFGKDGEERDNVHFVETWPSGKTLYAAYDVGTRVLETTVDRQTVTLIQEVRTSLYCDELTATAIPYRYAGQERDKDITRYLNQMLKPKSSYQPFSKGLIWDTQRSVVVSFDGLQFLPKGTVTVTAKNGSDSAIQRQTFDFWKGGDNRWIQFNEITWNPSEWTVAFSFDNTSATNLYHWKAK